MKKKLSQFHAVIDELINLITSFSENFSGSIMVELFPPKENIVVNSDLLLEYLARSNCREVVFSPNVGLKDPQQFHTSNVIAFSLGRQIEGRLQQSALWATIYDDEFEKSCSPAFAELKKVTKAGVHALSTYNGKSAFYKSFRYSQGAKKFEEQGGVLLPVAGNNIIKITM